MRRFFVPAVASVGILSVVSIAGPATDKRFCADSNGDGIVDLSDAVTVLNYLFMPDSREPYCMDGAASTIDNLNARIDELEIALSVSQTKPRYPACIGQENRFVNNQDGTVTDNCANLMWLYDGADVNGDGIVNLQDTLPWGPAMQFVDSLVFAGHDDWRLPSATELITINDFSRHNPSTYFPVFYGRGTEWWSSTQYAQITDLAWMEDSTSGSVYPRNKIEKDGFVRAVRTP